MNINITICDYSEYSDDEYGYEPTYLKVSIKL